MDQQTMTMQCGRCRKNARMLDMVVDASRRGMVCRTCAGLPPRDSPRAMPIADRTIKDVTRADPHPRIKDDGARRKYACTSCNYRFASSKGVSNLHCPYCGSASVESDLRSSASALIAASVDRRFDR